MFVCALPLWLATLYLAPRAAPPHDCQADLIAEHVVRMAERIEGQHRRIVELERAIGLMQAYAGQKWMDFNKVKGAD